jgi:hypothetical protein
MEGFRDDNLQYNRMKAAQYALTYAEAANPQYPYFKEDDCANFVSQVLHAGGIAEIGNRWDDFNSWFCHTNQPADLHKIAITWRAARYFRRHFANENGVGRNRAAKNFTITVNEGIQGFEHIYETLELGDVIQYGNPASGNIPYHTQVVCNKGFNHQMGRLDLFMAQHTVNSKNLSLYQYLFKLNHPAAVMMYLYKIK